jgi:uncharacterized damage-inducible protein DinB
MSEVQRLVGQIKMVFVGDETGEARFGPALMHLLTGVDSTRAQYRVSPDTHNIWELVLHLTAWKKYTAARLRDEAAPMNDEMDWAKVTRTDDAAWNEALQKLHEAQAELIAAAEKLTDEQLDTPVANGRVPRYLALQGIFQHDIYHAGQIAYLKKLSA